MFRAFIIIGIFTLSFTIYSLFYIKYQVIELSKSIETYKKEIHKEKETIYILRAENTFLSKPTRIRKLAYKYLDLEPTKIAQLINKQPDDIMVSENVPKERQQKTIKWRYKKNVGSNLSTVVMRKGK